MSNVVNLADRRKAKKEEVKTLDSEVKKTETFEELAQKNKENSERVKKERLSANKNVLRSYRIKN